MSNTPYIAIGGIGGSGTRVIALILKSLGLDIGININQALDNLIFTLLFKRVEILNMTQIEFNTLLTIYEKSFTKDYNIIDNLTKTEIKIVTDIAQTNHNMHNKEWLLKIAYQLIYKIDYFEEWYNQKQNKTNIEHRDIPRLLNGLGWKEPNTHIILDKLIKYYPNMKYIHVVRNGLDMAFSKNQNQLRIWGKYFLKKSDLTNTHYASLKYWCIVHKRIINIGNQMGPDRFLLINFDKLCINPKKYLKKICTFLDISDSVIPLLIPLIDPPSDSIGKFRNYDTSIFDPDDLSYVEQLGFDIE